MSNIAYTCLYTCPPISFPLMIVHLSNLVKNKKEMKRKPTNKIWCGLTMVLKTEPNIKPFFFKFPVQPRFLTSFPVFDRLLTDFGGFNRTGLTPGSRLNRSDRLVRFLKQWVWQYTYIHINATIFSLSKTNMI